MKETVIQDPRLFKELSREILRQGGCFRFQARGWSMVPFIRDKDILTVAPATIESLQIGDIIFYSKNSALFAHRLIKKKKVSNGLYLLTRGDIQATLSRPVWPEQILGKIVVLKRGRKKINFSSRRWQLFNFLIAIFSPLIRSVYLTAFSLRKLCRP